MTAGRIAAAAAALAALAAVAAGPAAADRPRPGERLYVVLFDHDQNRFSAALRTGADFLAGGNGRSFRIMLDSYAVLSAVRGVTMTQRDYLEVKRRHPNLAVIVCKEAADGLARANKGRRVPYLPGIDIRPCKGMRDRLDKEGWRTALGF